MNNVAFRNRFTLHIRIRELCSNPFVFLNARVVHITQIQRTFLFFLSWAAWLAYGVLGEA